MRKYEQNHIEGVTFKRIHSGEAAGLDEKKSMDDDCLYCRVPLSVLLHSLLASSLLLLVKPVCLLLKPFIAFTTHNKQPAAVTVWKGGKEKNVKVFGLRT